MQASYEQVVGYLTAREGAPCDLAGCPLAEAPALAGGLLAGVEVPVDAPGIRVRSNLGAIEPLSGSVSGHRISMLADDGSEIGVVTLTRDSFAGAGLDPAAPVLLVEIHVGDRPAAADQAEGDGDLYGWVWLFDFSGPIE